MKERRREGFPLNSKQRTFMQAMRTFPLPRPKCSFPFPTCFLLFSLPRRDSSFSPSRYFSLLRTRILLFSLHTYVRTLVERSWFITVLALEYGCRGGIMSALIPMTNKLGKSFKKGLSVDTKYKESLWENPLIFSKLLDLRADAPS